jgi:hypothetical protein
MKTLMNGQKLSEMPFQSAATTQRVRTMFTARALQHRQLLETSSLETGLFMVPLADVSEDFVLFEVSAQRWNTDQAPPEWKGRIAFESVR